MSENPEEDGTDSPQGEDEQTRQLRKLSEFLRPEAPPYGRWLWLINHGKQ